jgi:hypothetical protein
MNSLILNIFSNIVPEVRETHVDSATDVVAEVGCSGAHITNVEASPKFTEELEHTVKKDSDLIGNPLSIVNHEEVPEDQDPTLSIEAYNESFGTSFRGELLSVSGEVIGTDGGVHKFSLRWTSSKLMGEAGGDASKKKLRLSGKAVSGAEKQTSSLQKSMTIFDSVVQVPLGSLNIKGLYVTFLFIFCWFSCSSYITCCCISCGFCGF